MFKTRNCSSHCDADFQYRLALILLSLDMLRGTISPAIWILCEADSLIYRISHLATWPTMLAVVWMMLSFCIVPYIVMQVAYPKTSHYTALVRLACFGVCISGVLWVYLAYLSRNFDYDVATLNFIFNGLASIGLGAVLARGLNNQQIADEQEEQRLCAERI